ncbi:hypothetical protein [Aeromonas dhakensis]|nr:hypothetical protein [Aeromonas dhakensis]
MFPTEFERSHELCLYIHDVMVEFIKSGEMHDVFNQSININEEEAGIQIISATLMDEWREVANC